VFPNVDFPQMVGLYPMPGSTYALAVSRDGVVRRANLANGSEAASVYLDIRDRVNDEYDEEGLLGLALAPDFASSGIYYVNYTAADPRRTVISRFTGPNPGTEQVLLQIPQPFANHNGGHLAFGPDGYLYIALGDGGSFGDPEENGQDTSSLLGKILRIDVSQPGYLIPRDNPFTGGGGRAEIWAFGFRNPWRFSFDRETGQLWAGDVGQYEWEEIDRVVRGGNYGWDNMEGNACYEPPSGCNTQGLLAPRVVYDHDQGCAVTGGFVYRGSEMPELRGWYVYGDYCSGRVWAVNAATDAGDAVPLADTGVSISSFMEDPAGELYLVTFDNAIFKLVRNPG
jgi:glucose/arabinose dehydrogenase